MTMPEASMNKDRYSVLRKDHIGLAGKYLGIDSKAKTLATQ